MSNQRQQWTHVRNLPEGPNSYFPKKEHVDLKIGDYVLTM